MKFYLSSLFLAFSAVGSVLADEATCKKDAELVSQHVGEKYNQEITCQVQTPSDKIRVISPGEAITMDLRPDRLDVYVDDNNVIQKASCG